MIGRLLPTLVLVVLLPSCGLIGHHFEKHPDDVESASVAPLSSGACDGVTALAPESLFVGPYELAEDAPEAGTAVAVDGIPDGVLLCTQLGCRWECCDNSCGYEEGCAYTIRVNSYNAICLSHSDFACGGTDCSPWCRPFSTEPRHTYRFVGTIRYEGLGRPYIDVTAYCRHD